LTRTIKAGGKLYSRPQRRPTFFMISLLTDDPETWRFADAAN
jgi:hypothetical protein